MMVSEDAVLKALDKPISHYAVLRPVDLSGSQEALQLVLLKMRDAGSLTMPSEAMRPLQFAAVS